MNLRQIEARDDAAIAAIIRGNLEAAHLNIPGTAYFDPELDHLSDYYKEKPAQRVYFVLIDDADRVVGGVGIAEFSGFEHCAELQKLYLHPNVKGLGLGWKLLQHAEAWARSAGYQRIYLETHSALKTAIHLYQKEGFTEIPKPDCVKHTTMNRFFVKS